MSERALASNLENRDPIVGFSVAFLLAALTGAGLIWRGGFSLEIGAVCLLLGSGMGALIAWKSMQRDLKRQYGDAITSSRRLARRIEDLRLRSDELSRTERELHVTQFELTTAQRLAKIGTWHWSIDRDAMLECSEETARILGVNRDEILALGTDQGVSTVHPDDHERLYAAYRDISASNERYEIYYRIVHPDGGIRHVVEIGEPVLDESGRPVEHLGTIQDVTELMRVETELRRNHEELERRVDERAVQLRSVHDALMSERDERRRVEESWREHEHLLRGVTRIARIGYAIWNNLEDKYDVVSRESASLFDMTPEEYLDRYSAMDTDVELIHPADRERYLARDKAFVQDPGPVQIEYRSMREGRGLQHFRELWTPVFNDDGELAQTIIVVQEMTELKQAQEQLRQAQKMEAVGQLTGGIAHDFNNLLAVIMGNLELIASETSNPPEWAMQAIAAAERGAQLTRHLLAFSRKQDLRPEPVDPTKLIDRMLDMLRRTLRESIEIAMIGESESWRCLVDQGQLENALLNLAINARDAMPDGGTLTIEISNTRIETTQVSIHGKVAPGEYVRVSVSDTGEGMTDDVIEHAFEPFFTTKDVGEGSGLGLSMVYGFLKQSGGHVSIDSTLNHGTTIDLYMPRFAGGASDIANR